MKMVFLSIYIYKMIENIDGSCWLISLLNTLFKINKINKMIEPKNIENT